MCYTVCNVLTVVMSEYNEAEADKLPLTGDPSTPLSPAEETRKAVHRKFLERQRSTECDKELASTMVYCVYTSKIKLIL